MIKDLFKRILGLDKRMINIQELPSQGLFYKNDFKIRINKASKKDIEEYENNYVKDDIGVIIYYIKKIVEKNTTLSASYRYDDIKSIDIIFIFLEIVKLTKGKAINFVYYNKDTDLEDRIEFGSKYFNYFQVGSLIKYYDYEEKCFNIYGYKYTLPAVGVENSLTNFLIIKSNEDDVELYNNLFYDFTHFVGDKNYLKFSEIENLIEIFNYDLDDREMKKVKNILELFSPIQRYALRKGDRIVEMTSKINLEKIWK